MAHRTDFFLFGSPIQHSLSPLLHNTGFKYHRLDKKYSLCDTIEIEKVVSVLQNPNTAGGSITIPHKQSIIPHVDILSDAARSIDAVNTIWKDSEGKIHGDNTDWQAIHHLIKQRLEGRNSSNLVGLVIGAGGTAHAACYTLVQLGASFSIFNRSEERAAQLASKFQGSSVCKSLDSLKSVDIVIGTVPPAASYPSPSTDHLIASKPIIVELVYHPRNTALAEQARAAQCPLIEGVEVLLEQGLRQFKIFSDGFDAPRKEIVEAFIENYAGGSLKSDIPFSFQK